MKLPEAVSTYITAKTDVCALESLLLACHLLQGCKHTQKSMHACTHTYADTHTHTQTHTHTYADTHTHTIHTSGGDFKVVLEWPQKHEVPCLPLNKGRHKHFVAHSVRDVEYMTLTTLCMNTNSEIKLAHILL